ncbi:DUF1080 domain-containing protein [Paenibacillus sp. P25]|nr:DUF1080 domain-containing protein [Paenibacillus sp. P25]
MNSNLQGYLPVSGAWSGDAAGGLKGVSDANANAFNMATVTAGTYFVFEADVKVESATPYAAGSLVFRSSADGSKGYVLSLDPNLDRLRLFDYATDTTIGVPYQTTIDPGSFYRLKITADGPKIQVDLNDAPAISVNDFTYSQGSIGFHVYNGTAYFQNMHVYEVPMNVSGWTALSGSWTPTSQGWQATAGSGQNAYAVSSASSDDFTYEADLLVKDTYAVGTLLFRSDASAEQGYAVQVDPNMDRLRLFKLNGDSTIATYNVTIDPGKVYHIRVKAEGPRIRVYFQSSFVDPTNGYDPVMTVNDTSFSSGHVGLNVYNGTVLFQNIIISDLSSNLDGWTALNGTWTPRLDGIKAVSGNGADAYRISSGTASDFILEADLKVDSGTPYGTAGLLFRGNSTGTAGYVVNIDPNLDQVRLFNANGGATMASAPRLIDPGKVYHLEVVANGSSIKVYVDGRSAPDISVTDTAYTNGRTGLNAYNGTAYFQNVYVTDLKDYSNEMYRPQYHYTQEFGKASDPERAGVLQRRVSPVPSG